jgi:hypothetical protein
VGLLAEGSRSRTYQEAADAPIPGLKPSRTTGYECLPQAQGKPAAWRSHARHRRVTRATAASHATAAPSGSSPAAIGAQYARVAHAARMPGAVEKLEDLDRTLATEANGVAILRGLNRTVLPRQ